MKNIFYCLLLLLCIPVFAGTNNVEIVSDCIIKRSTPNERFTVFTYTLEGILDETFNKSKEEHRRSTYKPKTPRSEMHNLLENMMLRCQKQLGTLTQEEAGVMGEILISTIMLDAVNNPKVQELYK